MLHHAVKKNLKGDLKKNLKGDQTKTLPAIFLKLF